MLASLWLPIVVSAVALFFASFLSWMVLPFHFLDWRRLKQEDELLPALRQLDLPEGNYMFPGWDTPEYMKSEEYTRKWQEGPRGVLTVFGEVSMAKNLGLTLLYFLAVSFCLAYLAQLHIGRGADFMTVFRFVATAGLMTFLAAIIQHAIWFHIRITGHVIESIVYAVLVGVIFGFMWPGA